MFSCSVNVPFVVSLSLRVKAKIRAWAGVLGGSVVTGRGHFVD